MVIGATGQIGRVAVRALARDGWEVTAVSRGGGRDAEWPDEVRVTAADRADDAALAAVVGDGCDVLVDMVAYGPEHARQLTGLAGRVGSAVVISSVSVYEDAKGRNFDTQEEPDGFPEYPVPIPEEQRTVRPGEDSYSARKAGLERELLAVGDKLPTTLLRAGAIHGPYCRTPRELYFVKRNLDGRRRRVLPYGGASRFHPASVHNIAELIRLAAARPGTRALNAVDAEAPTVAEIAGAIDAVMGVEGENVLVDGPPPAPTVGDTPWSVPVPVVSDMSAAERELGYRPVITYAESLPETVAWIEDRLAGRDWREAYPKMFATYGDLFDYAAEDAWLA
ncbi:NAD-dependent epimerase/dehydratase family protein [Streptomyces turgidiscabies]|uniref:NAD dependent epimerase/dehydratase family protein n=1 Tax=Streptomyces turgidiscabies (strain Car8) TaxID=698760 RepID=L7FIV0_STRT8|nr:MULTISPECIES: NAD(P)-dependent oxidoreductase [Streptomyces]ELP71262.1 NAD dependent epimerase/dehydratase family protein [Streptomyces turgidiscabies Car8]MDX3494716.1 NAD(P)-dependent oxidoreductase [Streptomyces turgidiscabies]